MIKWGFLLKILGRKTGGKFNKTKVQDKSPWMQDF